MLIMAVTGMWPAAAAWSSNEDERRKALLSYFMEGVPYIIWDNIRRGHLDRPARTSRSPAPAKFYKDRKLGVSEVVATSCRHHPLLHRQQHQPTR